MSGRLDQGALFDLPVVQPCAPDAATLEQARRLHERWGSRLRLGTSSWHFPGWRGLVWSAPHDAAVLSRHGLPAYAAHPLLGAVSLDRAFYRALDAGAYAALAAQVPDDFRFVVKAASSVTDALLREPGTGRALRANPGFLDPGAAVALCAQPALQGLGTKLGALVFQLSPLPAEWLQDRRALLAKLDALWPALPAGCAPALELRDPALLGPDLAAHLKAHGVRYVLGLHDRMPPLEDQLPMLRALWPGDLVCRWNLQRGQRYADAKDAWAPFDRLAAPDPATRAALAKVIRGTLDGGRQALVTINNKAEGSAPISVKELAALLA